MSRLDALRRSPLFDGVSSLAISDAASVVIERQFACGEFVVEQDTKGDALHLVTSGCVRVVRMSIAGRERVMGDIYAPGVVGETAVLEGGERSASVYALEPVTTFMLYRDHFEQLLRRHPQVLWNLSRMLAQRVTSLNDELIALGLNTEAGLAHVFTHLYEQRLAAGVPHPELLPLTTQDIMSRLSTSRETVSRVMRRLEKRGQVKVTAAGIQLLDPGLWDQISLEALDVD